MNDVFSTLLLSQIDGLGTRTIALIIENCGTAHEFLSKGGRGMRDILGRGLEPLVWRIVDAQKDRSVRLRIERLVEQAQVHGYRAVPLSSNEYPPKLKKIADPPAVLWAMGDVSGESGPAVAIVGTRKATAYGTRVARVFARDLCLAGIPVISGLAAGIDRAAHEACVMSRGKTVAVLGQAIEFTLRSTRLAARIIDSGGLLLSEYPPGTGGKPHHFPARNRIISGLSDVVVIVEAPKKSGALITASSALEQGREVMAVPGSVFSDVHEGCHDLIRDGAGIAVTTADILRAMGPFSSVPRSVQCDLPGLLGLTEAESEVFLAIRRGSGSFADASETLGICEVELGKTLSMLEIKGFISKRPDGTFEATS